MQVVWIGNVFFTRRNAWNEKKWQEMKRNEKKLRQWTNSEQKWKEMKTMNNKWKEMKRNETNEQKWKEMNTWKKFFFLSFFPLGSRDSGITCFWLLILIDNMFLEIIFVFSFPFLAKKRKTYLRNKFFFLKKTGIANVLQGCFWSDVLWKNLRLFVRGQRCQNKVSFDRPQPEQIK